MLDNQENSAKCEIWITKGNCTKASSCSWTLDQCNEETEEEFECRDFSTEESCPSECTWSPGVEGREWDGGCR